MYRNVTGVVLTAFVVILSPAVSTDGRRVSWKDNFESHYTEVAELGRLETQSFITISCNSQNQHWTFTNLLFGWFRVGPGT